MTDLKEEIFSSKEYPYISLQLTILESDISEHKIKGYADTGAEDYDIIIFDPLFDNSKIRQQPIPQYLPLAGSSFGLHGFQYLCKVNFGSLKNLTTTTVIVREKVEKREIIIGRGLLDQFKILFDGQKQQLSIFS